MKIIKSLALALTISLGLFTMNSHALSQYFPLTPSQKHFTTIISQLKTFRAVEWESPVSMWVQIPSSQSGRAAELANTIEDRARGALMQPFCVHIYASKNDELAKSCVY
ncbi:MAG: hypothetical protein RIG61_05280 [Deltaproteobacteria bacterium]